MTHGILCGQPIPRLAGVFPMRCNKPHGHADKCFTDPHGPSLCSKCGTEENEEWVGYPVMVCPNLLCPDPLPDDPDAIGEAVRAKFGGRP